MIVALLWVFFQKTRVGLGARAAALNPDSSRLHGVRVSWMLALGWGLAAVLGAVAGILVAPTQGSFDQNFMLPILIFAFAAAVLGGLDSPLGAVVGGVAVGIALNLIGTYIDFFADLPPAGGAPPDPRDPAAAAERALRTSDREARVTALRYGLRALGLALFVAVVAYVPFRLSPTSARPSSRSIGIYFIAILGLNILTGYTGAISLGHGAFMAIGAYTTAILVRRPRDEGPLDDPRSPAWSRRRPGSRSGCRRSGSRGRTSRSRRSGSGSRRRS